MRVAKAIAVYAVAVVFLGALVAPVVFWAVNPLLPDVPLRRVFDRAILGAALIGLWPLLRGLGINSWTEVGFVRSPAWWRHGLAGFAIGLLSFAVVAVVLVALGFREFAVPARGIAGQLWGALATGLVVGVLEETFFRGGLQSAIQKGTRLPVAVVITSAVYSIVHFLRPKSAGIGADAVNWFSGFDYLGQILTRSWQSPGVLVGFVTLFLAGCVLGLTFARSRALYLPVGVHAGWVFTLKSYAAFTHGIQPRAWWGGTTLVDNVLVWPVLLLLLVFVVWLCPSRLKSLQ